MAQEATQIITLGPDAALRDLRDKQKRVERLTLLLIVGFVAAIFLLVLIPTGFYGSAGEVIFRLEHGGDMTRNVSAICHDPRNKNTPFCLERAARRDSDWKQLSRFSGGKSNQFTLHGKE